MGSSTDDPKVIVRDLVNATSEGVQKLVLDIVDELIEVTPVDTGWAQVNWIPSIGAPVTSPVGSNEETGSARAAQAAGSLKVLGYSLNDGDVFVTNNVPYIEALNNGSSQKAPAAFVETTIDVALARANNQGELN